MWAKPRHCMSPVGEAEVAGAAPEEEEEEEEATEETVAVAELRERSIEYPAPNGRDTATCHSMW